MNRRGEKEKGGESERVGYGYWRNIREDAYGRRANNR